MGEPASDRQKPSSFRLQISVPDSLYDKIEAYAETMGISIPEASRHLMIRGLEQVQALVSSKNSVDALRRMTEALDRGFDIEEEYLKAASQKKKKKVASKLGKKPVRDLVTPAQSLKNETNGDKIKDMFNHD